MIDFSSFYQLIENDSLSYWLNTLPIQMNAWKKRILCYKDAKQQYNVVKELPIITPSTLELFHGISANNDTFLHVSNNKKIEFLLKQLMPWRKGPFFLYGININSEWRSDWKWNRIAPHITSLIGRKVLDVGCNNGYYLWRMIGAGVKLAVGIDPMSLCYFQFEAIRKLIGNRFQAYLLPLLIGQLPKLRAFDTVFSMGVIYHCRSPLDHLIQLKNQLVSGGELILETLIIKGNNYQIFMPNKRYAKMRNIYFIPSPSELINWLKKCDFINIRLINISITRTDEQRKTSWMTRESLENFLNPDDHKLTIEGYPAPSRAIFIAEKP